MRRLLLTLVLAGSMLAPVAAHAAINCVGQSGVMFCHGTERSESTTINYVDLKVAPVSPVEVQVQVAQIDDGSATTTGAGGCAVGRCRSYVTGQLPLLPPIP